MTYQSAYLQIDLTASKEKKQFTINIDFNFSKLLGRIFNVVFVGPRLIRKTSPGKYEVVASHRGGLYF